VKYNLPDVSCSNGFYFWKIISSKQLMKLHCLVCFFDIALQVEHCDYLYTAPGRPALPSVAATTGLLRLSPHLPGCCCCCWCCQGNRS